MKSSLAAALSERGYDTLTPVQAAVSDAELSSADLLVSAPTGSGKTVAFGLAIAPTLLEESETFGPAAEPLALIVAPTRELALQVMRELRWLYGKAGAVIASCVGGMDMRDERRALGRGAHIVVGTPGRLCDHINRGSLDLAGLRALVLDEADEMLDLGFREDLEFMLGEAPDERRTLLFSATVPPMIVKLAAKYQRDARRLNLIGDKRQHADIAYQAICVAQSDSENAIFNLLRYHDAESAMVFANTRVAVNHLLARLTNRGFSVVCLSGELTQSERTNALQAMRDGRARVCVATDVAARGIDLPNLDLVIYADLPVNQELMLHRSGRTGRAGRKGVSALIVPPKAVKKMERLFRFAKITAEWTTAPSADDIQRLDEERLLNDPAWNEPLTDSEIEFAEKLLARQGAEAVAAAYYRLYRAGRSAPEDLLPPDEKPKRRERGAFGPSEWVSLSIGREQGAEPRWLLPMLCRAGGFDKTAIGAIRIEDRESFAEISRPLIGQLMAAAPNGALEDNIRLRRVDGPPSQESRHSAPSDAPSPRKPRKPKPDFDAGAVRPAKPKRARAETAGKKPKPASRKPGKPETGRKLSKKEARNRAG